MHRPGIIGARPHHGGAPYVGPLDIVPGAVVAYSQRAMTGGSTADAITIKRDGDDTTQAFPLVNNAVDVAAVTAFLGGANGFVVALFDQSGNSADLDNGSPQPAWTVSGPNGKPAIGNVDVASLYTTNTVTFPNGAATVFLVCKQNGGNSSLGSEMNFNTSSYVRFQAPTTGGSTAIQDIYDDDTTSETLSQYDIVASDAYQLWDGAWSIPTGHSMLLNGVAQTPSSIFDTAMPPGSITDLLIMNFGDAGEFLAEIIMYDTVLSAPHRLAIRQNIADYYGIPLP